MPQLQAKTVSAEKVWSTPDGKKTIWSVGLDINGKQFIAKTYSQKISVVGWSGTLETYEKEGRNGHETFVKQPQQEQSYGGSHSNSHAPKGDSFTMYLSYVKDLASALIASNKSLDELPAIVEQVALEGKHLYALREGAPEEANVKPAEPHYEEVDVRSELDKLFPDEDKGAEPLPL